MIVSEGRLGHGYEASLHRCARRVQPAHARPRRRRRLGDLRARPAGRVRRAARARSASPCSPGPEAAGAAAGGPGDGRARRRASRSERGRAGRALAARCAAWRAPPAAARAARGRRRRRCTSRSPSRSRARPAPSVADAATTSCTTTSRGTSRARSAPSARFAYDRAARPGRRAWSRSPSTRATRIAARCSASRPSGRRDPRPASTTRASRPAGGDGALDALDAARRPVAAATRRPCGRTRTTPRLLAALAARPAGVSLVLTGRDFGREAELRRGRAASASRDRVHHARATSPPTRSPRSTAPRPALVFPSLAEGFGQPPLEAMACGCPVAASDTGAVAEACGDAALRFPTRATSRRSPRAMTRLVDRRRAARRAARGRAASARAAFTWERAAARHAEVYASALSTAAPSMPTTRTPSPLTLHVDRRARPSRSGIEPRRSAGRDVAGARLAASGLQAPTAPARSGAREERGQRAQPPVRRSAPSAARRRRTLPSASKPVRAPRHRRAAA